MDKIESFNPDKTFAKLKNTGEKMNGIARLSSGKPLVPMTEKLTKQIWLTTGYELFARHGFAGIVVERLAKKLNLNKSGFYHYFGEQEIYLEELMNLHVNTTNIMAQEMGKIRQIDPDYFNLLVHYKIPIIFHNQLVRHREQEFLHKTFLKVNSILDPIAARLFVNFFGFDDRQEFSVKYYYQIRDMFHSQITFERMNFEFLRNFTYEAKEVIQAVIVFTAMHRAQTDSSVSRQNPIQI